VTDEWPSRSYTTCGCTPAWSASVAWVCRRPWTVSRGSPERFTSRSNSSDPRSGCQVGAVLAGENAAAVGPGRPPGQPLLELALAPFAQHAHGAGVARQRAAAVISLWLRLLGRVLDLDQRVLHRPAGGVQVEVGPIGAQRLAAPDPGRREHVPERVHRWLRTWSRNRESSCALHVFGGLARAAFGLGWSARSATLRTTSDQRCAAARARRRMVWM
jgi:hypothetical protein